MSSKNRFSTMSTFEIDQKIIQYLREYPQSSIQQIADGIGKDYLAVWRTVTQKCGASGRLYENYCIECTPSYNKKTGRLMWVYELV